MYNATHNPEVVVPDRYLLHKTISDRAGMTALSGFDQQAEQEIFIKCRNPQVDENAARRVSREADILESLHHSQIPPLIDADPDADKPYIVTPLIDNHPKITDGFKHNPNPVFAAELCVAALAPLGYAHETGFTHRDIKPGNLLMSWDGDVALCDWEIALCKDRTLAEATYKDTRYDDWRVTSFGCAWGSKGYMSPEQAEGRYKIQDGRSDVYAMGAVLHLFLHGKLPKRGKDSSEQTIKDIVGSNTRSYSPSRPVPVALQEVAERALQEEPADRYQSAAEMSADLERYLTTTSLQLAAAA
ncbi:MAG TPA: serine/threonine-protein kinase [Candidatus Saccharimonadales bacterium]|nr:serine/threonine-protein kinase [Candidatus Saccharimonadales bacterium]